MLTQFSRTELLLGKEAMDRLKNARVAVFGIGGVGGYVCEALVRTGVGYFDLIDDDKVCLTNLNRQIIATRKTVGKYKTEVMKERMLEINPDVKVEIHDCFFLPENAKDFPFEEYDYIVDAVDTVTAKIALVMKAKEMDIPIISSMGAGNKLDASKFEVADIYKTSVCPLAKVMRRELKKRGVKKLKVSDQDQLITSNDWTEISNLQDEMKKEEPDATIDYDKALKVYVDCNLIKLQTADTKKLTSALESANYVWVIPFKMEKTYGMFTVAKGLPLREEAKSVLTKAEQEEVKNHAGKWMITETAEHTVEPYYDILLEKREALSDCTRVVLVGSQPGMRQPVALGMDDETARIWISLGYQYPVMEKIPETQNVESGVYSFDSVAEISDTYIEDSEVSTGAGVQSRSSMKYVAGIGIVLIGSILILSVLKKKKIKSED